MQGRSIETYMTKQHTVLNLPEIMFTCTGLSIVFHALSVTVWTGK